MTTYYCRHCAEPLAGPRESGGVCQRCVETENERLDAAMAAWDAELPDRVNVIAGLLADGADDTPAPDWDRLRADEAEDAVAGADVWLRVASALPIDADADAVVARRIAEVTGAARTRAIAARMALSADAELDEWAARWRRAEKAFHDKQQAEWQAWREEMALRELAATVDEPLDQHAARNHLGSDGPDDGGQS